MKKIDLVELAKELGLPEVPEEQSTDGELVAQIANMKIPVGMKDFLMADLSFHKAIDNLIEKERQCETKEDVRKLTAAVWKLCK